MVPCGVVRGRIRAGIRARIRPCSGRSCPVGWLGVGVGLGLGLGLDPAPVDGALWGG